MVITAKKAAGQIQTIQTVKYFGFWWFMEDSRGVLARAKKEWPPGSGAGFAQGGEWTKME